MSSQVHMIIGSKQDKLADIVRDMKKYTSSELKVAIKNHPQESRKECLPAGRDYLDDGTGRKEK